MVLSKFKPDNKHIGILSQETFESLQEYIDQDPQLDSIQRKIGWKKLSPRHFYLSSLDEFSKDTQNIPKNLLETNGINEFTEPEGYQGHIECLNKDLNYLSHTGALF